MSASLIKGSHNPLNMNFINKENYFSLLKIEADLVLKAAEL